MGCQPSGTTDISLMLAARPSKAQGKIILSTPRTRTLHTKLFQSGDCDLNVSSLEDLLQESASTTTTTSSSSVHPLRTPPASYLTLLAGWPKVVNETCALSAWYGRISGPVLQSGHRHRARRSSHPGGGRPTIIIIIISQGASWWGHFPQSQPVNGSPIVGAPNKSFYMHNIYCYIGLVQHQVTSMSPSLCARIITHSPSRGPPVKWTVESSVVPDVSLSSTVPLFKRILRTMCTSFYVSPVMLP